MRPEQPLTYKDAGVDIDAGDALIERIKPLAKSTHRPGVMGGLGGFGGLFELDPARWPRPVLVAGADGVGTKLKLAIELGRYDTVGIDLVAMCVNDVVVQGAEPLFFLDYYASGKLDLDVAEAVISGIAEGCRQAGAALLGGETAELPGMYTGQDLDLAGFCVGVADRSRLIDGSRIEPGDVVLGLASSGPHSNGYSLVRHILGRSAHGAETPWTRDDVATAGATTGATDGTTGAATGAPASTLGAALLAPTRIYVRPLLAAFADGLVKGLAHITGGGLPGNVARVLPANVDAVLHRRTWRRPTVFDWLQTEGHVSDDEMLRTFNCGIGMTAIVSRADAERTAALLAGAGETVRVIGEIEAGSGRVDMRE